MLLYFFVFASLYSQETYKSCLNNGLARWSIFSEVTDYGYNSIDLVAYGDTLINGYSYKKVFRESFVNTDGDNEDWINYKPQLTLQWNDYFLRESEDASQIFLLNTYFKEEEHLICDLNLKVGSNFEMGKYSYVVDSVYWKDNLKHIQLFTWMGAFEGEKLTFIEGVVSNSAFLYPYERFGYSYTLNCFKNNILFYKKDGYFEGVECGYSINFLDMQKEEENTLCEIFLSNNEILLLFNNNQNRTISLYSVSGDLIYTKEENNKEITICKPGRGIFLIRIQDKKTNHTYTQKVIL